MPRRKNPITPINVGDFVFAKVHGYRAWPARILEVSSRYSVYFYGTCNTCKVNRSQIFPYAQHKKSLGNLAKPRVGRNSKFRMAIKQLELVYNDPDKDFEYLNLLAELRGECASEELVYGMLDDSSMSETTDEEKE